MALTLSHKTNAELMEAYHSVSVFQQLRYAILGKLKRGEDVIRLIQGRHEAKNDVIRALLSGSHPYLVSQEGTGKTRLARSVAELLPPVPRIAGCPYNDDPAWGKERLCPRCASVSNPAEHFGIEWITGLERFSRIQGNEYTNEAKLLGLKDIQAIASGMSPDDPRTFTGTGVFRANRGLLFIDELPAIRTKVQVLLHPILEEQRTILEEYGWEYPLDLCVAATGNPEGFAHVNEVPRPLIDRLETVYLELPEENVELGIMAHREDPLVSQDISTSFFDLANHPEDDRAYAPWWLLTIINKAVRQSRICRWLERASSIRGTMRAADHAYSSALMRGGTITNIEDAAHGIKLSLRGRIHLRQDLVDIDDPGETFRRVDELSQDLLRTAIFLMAQELVPSWNLPDTSQEIKKIIGLSRDEWPGYIAQNAPAIRDIIGQWEMAGTQAGSGVNYPDDVTIMSLAGQSEQIRNEYLKTCTEFIANMLMASNSLPAEGINDLYIPREITWSQGL